MPPTWKCSYGKRSHLACRPGYFIRAGFRNIAKHRMVVSFRSATSTFICVSPARPLIAATKFFVTVAAPKFESGPVGLTFECPACGKSALAVDALSDWALRASTIADSR